MSVTTDSFSKHRDQYTATARSMRNTPGIRKEDLMELDPQAYSSRRIGLELNERQYALARLMLRRMVFGLRDDENEQILKDEISLLIKVRDSKRSK